MAETELALASRELGWPAKTLETARKVLETHGDRVNAAHARFLEIRRQVLIGRFADAERGLSQERVAHLAGIAGFTYQKFEKGESRPGTPMNPQLLTLLSLTQVLEVTLEELTAEMAGGQELEELSHELKR